MDDVRDIRIQLEAIRTNNQDNESLITAFEYLSKLEREFRTSTPSTSTWSAFVNELKHLQNQGLWGTVAEQRRLSESALKAMEHADSSRIGRPGISIMMPPTERWVPVIQVPTLPPELLEQINEVYLLHSLANHPEKVLPSGKSLLSLLSSRGHRAHEGGSQQPKTLKDQVSEVVTRAFWDEALESLESPTPGVQLSRLQLLYADLRTAVSPLIPSSHPIIYTFSDPLSPTSSPLRSASGHLRVLLSVLRERCAPIRDTQLDGLLERLEDPPLAELPKVCIETIRDIFDMAEQMKDDLADFVVGTWTEQDAQRWIRGEAIQCERHAVLEIFPAEVVKSSYREWLGLGSEEHSRPVVIRLIGAFSSTVPVSPFPPSDNILPPPFIFSAFDVLKAQNLLQALVITASLRSLVEPVTGADTHWLSRVWVLLETEVERGGTEPAETKLLNLEDEVVQAARSPVDTDTERQLREAVRRTLRSQDPVFVLLQSRLLTAIQDRLVEDESALSPAPMPMVMRSGQGKPKEVIRDEAPQERELSVKGFEDTVLKENIKKLVVLLRNCLRWTDEVWGGFLNKDIA